MENKPTAAELDDYYCRYSYSPQAYLSPITIKSYNALLDDFEQYRRTNKLLDVGCGMGWFLQEAKKRGWQVYGTEFSDTAVRLCEEAGLQMWHGRLCDNAFADNEFDIITSFEVIEHINNPVEEIGYIRRFLRRGGLFYCTTPNFNAYLRLVLKDRYNNITYPEHLSYYTKRTLRKLLILNGFRKRKMQTTGISISHFKTSLKPNYERLNSQNSSDEKLRRQIDEKRFLKVMKIFVNKILTLLGIGISLKAWFIKI